MALTFRRATIHDAPQIAAFHDDVWQATYCDIAPKAARDKLNEAHRLAAWRAQLSGSQEGRMTRLAFDDQHLLGLVDCAVAARPVFDGRGEIKHLYVGAPARGTGIGRSLLGAARSYFALQPVKGVGLAVVEENLAARNFYCAMSGTETARFADPGPLWQSRNILVTWGKLQT